MAPRRVIDGGGIAFDAKRDLREPFAPKEAYSPAKPDYTAHYVSGVRAFQRNTYSGNWEVFNPSENTLVKAGISSVVGSSYQLTPTGRQVPLSTLIPNPFGRSRERSGFYTADTPTIVQGDVEATIYAPGLVRRDR